MHSGLQSPEYGWGRNYSIQDGYLQEESRYAHAPEDQSRYTNSVNHDAKKTEHQEARTSRSTLKPETNP
jgi:hypothetical protein